MRALSAVARLLILGAVAAMAPAVSNAENAQRPNVLFIAIDDLNDWTGCLGGHPNAKTPNIDRLAARGVNFTNAHCAAPACNPSRAALMTGILPSTSGVYTNPQPWRPVMADAVTIPQHFMAHGYRALGAGKIYHGGYPDKASWNDYAPNAGVKPKPLAVDWPVRAGGLGWGPVEGDDDVMEDYHSASWAIDQLRAEHGKPFFLACGIKKPHLSFQAPMKYFDMHPLDGIVLPEVKEDDLDDVPEAGKKMAKASGDHANIIKADAWRHAVQGYLASSSFADAQVGRLIDALDASPYAENTIVVLWSDHGWHLGEKSHWRKFALWEEAARTLLMIVAPGVTRPGGQCSSPASLIDIYPTLVDLCDLAPKEELAGLSLRPWLEDPSAPRERPALTTHGRNNHALRNDRWRYIRYADGSEELYDHDRDELEWTNLAGDPEYDEIKRSFAPWLPQVNVPNAPFDPEKKGGRGKEKSQAE
jgi:arylsulfatase A-like enzyme